MEKTMKSERAFKGRIINVRVDTVELNDRRYAKREIVEHRGGATIIPITDEGKIVLVKQFRKAAESFLIEIPAGTRELNEEPRITSLRELAEETGYHAEQLDFLGEIMPSPGYSTECIYIFLATQLTKGEPDPDEDETIEVIEVTLEEALSYIQHGKIIDAKTIIAILHYAQFKKRWDR